MRHSWTRLNRKIHAKKTKRSSKAAYAGSAYVGQELPEHVEAQICEKGYRNHPLTEEQKQNNKRKSKIRCRALNMFLDL